MMGVSDGPTPFQSLMIGDTFTNFNGWKWWECQMCFCLMFLRFFLGLHQILADSTSDLNLWLSCDLTKIVNDTRLRECQWLRVGMMFWLGKSNIGNLTVAAGVPSNVHCHRCFTVAIVVFSRFVIVVPFFRTKHRCQTTVTMWGLFTIWVTKVIWCWKNRRRTGGW